MIGGLIYSFLYPAFSNAVIAAGSFHKKWGTQWVFKISKTGSISTTKYFELKDKYNRIIQELTERISGESIYKTALETQKVDFAREKLEIEKKIQLKDQDLENEKNVRSHHRVLGKWYTTSKEDRPFASSFLYDNIRINEFGVDFCNGEDIKSTYKIIETMGSFSFISIVFGGQTNPMLGTREIWNLFNISAERFSIQQSKSNVYTFVSKQPTGSILNQIG